jgi:hypothetical protein
MALSVTIDEVLAISFTRGVICYIGGLLFSIALTEVLLFSLPIRLPLLYRIPYHLLLALFFLYPLAASPVASQPYAPAIQWTLFAFPAIGAAILLLLIPAIRKGPDYVNDNGTPWSWPLYPWTIFFFLILGIGWRGYYLCISLHAVVGEGTIFAPYFLLPLVLVVAWLLLEMGLVTNNRRVQQVAMLLPMLGCGMVLLPFRGGLVHDRFLELFFQTLGATPLFCSLLISLVFYVLATTRRVPHAEDWATAALAAWGMINYNTTNVLSLWDPWGPPLAVAGLLQLGLALHRRTSPRALLAVSALTWAAVIDLEGTWFMAWQGALPAHLWLASVLVIGLMFRDAFSRFLQVAGAWLLMGVTILAVTGGGGARELPQEVVLAYPLLACAAAIGHYWLSRNLLYAAATVATLGCWLVTSSVQAYQFLRPLMAGLDELLWGLLFFVCAALISLIKSGRLHRWLEPRRQQPSRLLE